MMGMSGAPAEAAAALAARTSSADCTKLSATTSTPIAMPARRSSTSFGVSADVRRAAPGTLIPLCDSRVPPAMTRVEISPGATPVISSSIPPVVEQQPEARAHGREQRLGKRRHAPRLAREFALSDDE